MKTFNFISYFEASIKYGNKNLELKDEMMDDLNDIMYDIFKEEEGFFNLHVLHNGTLNVFFIDKGCTCFKVCGNIKITISLSFDVPNYQDFNYDMEKFVEDILSTKFRRIGKIKRYEINMIMKGDF